MARSSTHRQKSASNLPVILMILGVLVATTAGVVYSLRPDWDKHNAQLPVINAGVVPTQAAPKPSGSTKNTPAPITIAPTSVSIPALQVKAPVYPISVKAGVLEPPKNPLLLGWWKEGPRLGAPVGTSIITGHINYNGVSGVFAKIGKLKPNEHFTVSGKDSRGKDRTLTYNVTGIRTYKKTVLPYKQIFSQTVKGRLVLVTCGGPFDADTGNYEDNVIVYAVPVKVPTS